MRGWSLSGTTEQRLLLLACAIILLFFLASSRFFDPPHTTHPTPPESELLTHLSTQSDIIQPSTMGTRHSSGAHTSSSSSSSSSTGSLFDPARFHSLIGLRAIDTARGDTRPADVENEGKTWIDVQKFARERAPGKTR